MYYIYRISGSSLLRDSTDSMILFCFFVGISPPIPNSMAFLRILLFCLLSQAKYEIYYITPDELEVADNCNSSCITLSRLATSTPFISSNNITLIFLPGSHNLTENLTFSNIDYILIAASNFTAQITCELSTHLAIENVQYTGISDIEFFGCGSNFIRNVAEFVLQDVLFDGHEESSTALQLIETTATLIATTFLSNIRGTLTDYDSLHILAGGAIIATHTNIVIRDCIFERNRAELGGAIYADQNSILSVENTTFVNNQALFQSSTVEPAPGMGGVLYQESGSIIIANCLFTSNSAPNLSGGVIYSNKSDVYIKASQFADSSASNGSIIFSYNGSVSIDSSQFDRNTATWGGVIQSSNSDVLIDRSQFSDNRVTMGGGIVHSLGGTVTLNDNQFRSSMATWGGILYANEHSQVMISRSQFNGSIATMEGGVFYCSTGDIEIQRSQFYNNSANSPDNEFTQGGVLYLFNGNVHINDSQFNSSAGTYYGGALISISGNVSISSSQVSAHKATNGGAISLFSSNIIIEANCQFDGNSAVFGGAVWANNSIITIRGENVFVNNTASDQGGAMSLFECKISINNSNFHWNSAATTAGSLYCSRSSVMIQASTLINNTATRAGVLESSNSDITVDDCRMIGNNANISGAVLYTSNSNIDIRNSHVNHSRVNVRNNGQGGVFNSINSRIEIYESIFYKNTGIDSTFYFFQSTVMVSKTLFTNNIGSLLATYTTVNFINFNSFESCMSTEVDRVNFEEGGALTAFQSTINFEGRTTFDNNQADYGGAIHSTESVLNITGTTIVSQNSATRNGGGIFLSQSKVFCQPSSLLRLEYNIATQEGGGIYAVGSTISVSIVTNETLLNIVGNVARRGGGLALNSNAKLYVLKQISFNAPIYAVQITDNSASLGGAFFVSDDSNSASCESPSTGCFLQVLAIHRNEMEDINTVALYISNNSAKWSASSAALYGGLLDRCTVSPLAEVHSRFPNNDIPDYMYNGSGLDYFLDSTKITPDIITSEAVKVCFCFNGFHNCSHLDPEIRVVKKGEPFVVSITAVDQVGQPVAGEIQSSLMFTQSGLAEGQLFQEVTDKCNDLTFNVFSSEKYETLTLHANGPCKGADLSMKSVLLLFLPCTCPIGFQPVNFNSTCECECHHSISRYVICDDQTGSFVRQSVNVWISYSNTSGYLVYPNCPYGYCESPDIRTPITLSQPNGSNAQCTFSRVSTLCASCESGLSLSLGGPRCLRCPHYWPALVVVIILAAALAGVALVAMLLFLNMTVAVGSLNGIIFYANVVAANRNVFPYETEPGIASVFISFLNLDIGIDTCFFEGMTTYSKTWLQLLFPLYVIVLVVLLIVISSYSTKFSNYIGKRDPVATLATLILLSYAKLLGISFTILSPGTLVYEDSSRQLVWLPDATITYFSGIHVPLFLVAIFILILGMLFTAVVFLWQWIVRLPNKPIFAWTRNQKLQLFIETYNIPYTPHHRYWTGMLLLARVIAFFIAGINVSNDRYLALTSITFILVCILCLKALTRGQVFKNWPLDLLETFFYFNILLLAIFTWYLIRPSNLTDSSLAALNASVIMALIVLIFIILYHIYSYTPLFLKFRETTIGKKFDEAFKSLSAAKQKQRKLETSEDNILLDMVYRPTNTEGYSSKKDSQHSTSQSQPTQPVIDISVVTY